MLVSALSRIHDRVGSGIVGLLRVVPAKPLPPHWLKEVKIKYAVGAAETGHVTADYNVNF